MTGYDKQEVQNWINQVESALDIQHEPTLEEQEIYDQIRVHYNHAEEKIRDEGLSEEASYEIEQAYQLLDQLAYELQIENEPRGNQSWEEFYSENI